LKYWPNALLLTTCIIFTGCEVGPNYHPPKSDIPDAWRQEKPMTAEPKKETDAAPQHPAPLDQKAIAELEWWKQFNDPVLNDLIVRGLAQNFDLKIAQAHIKGAHALPCCRKWIWMQAQNAKPISSHSATPHSLNPLTSSRRVLTRPGSWISLV